jgi:hypothetical protein
LQEIDIADDRREKNNDSDPRGNPGADFSFRRDCALDLKAELTVGGIERRRSPDPVSADVMDSVMRSREQASKP